MTRAEKARATQPGVLLYEPRHASARLPLSLLHVASALEARVAIVDGRLEMAPAALVAELAKDAACLGVTTPTGPALADALEVTRAAKAARQGLPVVWGGPHATFRPAECLATGLVDACVIGRGERTLAEIVAALRTGGAEASIPGMAFVRDEQVVESLPRPHEDVNHLPLPDYGLLDLERHFRHRGARRVEVVTSRGGGFSGEEWSGLVAERVVDLVRDLGARHHVAEVVFVDQGFFTNGTRVADIASGLLELAGHLSWEASATLPDLERALAVAPPEVLREGGARRIAIFMEEGLDRAVPVAEALLRAGLEVRARFVVGRGARDPESGRRAHRTARDLLALPGAIKVELGVFEAWPGYAEAEELLGAHGSPQGIEGWAGFDPQAFASSWLPAAARVRRWSFYLAQASRRPRRRLGQRLVHRLARARVRTGFYGLDLERRAVLGLRRARKALRLEPVAPVED